MTTPEQFRAELHTWLEEHGAKYGDVDPADIEAGRAFRAALWDAGFLGLTLDPAYGGRGLTDEHQRAFAEELGHYRLPPTGEAVTTGICAPTLLDFGTEEQKRRHIPRMIRGDEVWTQLLSEPGAGSDLAGLQTKAVRDGDEFVLTGQKVWTSGAMTSDFALCVARTDPDLPKHRGLSMFIVDLKAPGVTIRPLRQMTGDAHFNEVFLDEVRIPATALVGLENDGWRAPHGHAHPRAPRARRRHGRRWQRRELGTSGVVAIHRVGPGAQPRHRSGRAPGARAPLHGRTGVGAHGSEDARRDRGGHPRRREGISGEAGDCDPRPPVRQPRHGTRRALVARRGIRATELPASMHWR